MGAEWEDMVHAQAREGADIPDIPSAVVGAGDHRPRGHKGGVRSVGGGVGRGGGGGPGLGGVGG